MSKILDKPFDAEKKIAKTQFLGSPNLFTTSDLNRQISALKFQLDQLDDKTGVVSDLELLLEEIVSADGVSKIPLRYSYLYVHGCSFHPVSEVVIQYETILEIVSKGTDVYICLDADTATVTAAEDFTGAISGAAFEDGSVMEAANQLVYKNERISVYTYEELQESETTIAVLGRLFKAVVTSGGNGLRFESNCLSKRESALVNMRPRNYSLPIGAIIMWSGDVDSLPDGWALCDGRTINGVKTPDLQGRFILGQGERADKLYKLGTSGGAEYTRLTLKNIPAHQHFLKVLNGGELDAFGGATNFTPGNYNASSPLSTVYTSFSGGNVDTQGNKTDDANISPIDLMPPYYVLAYIIFVGY